MPDLRTGVRGRPTRIAREDPHGFLKRADDFYSAVVETGSPPKAAPSSTASSPGTSKDARFKPDLAPLQQNRPQTTSSTLSKRPTGVMGVLDLKVRQPMWERFRSSAMENPNALGVEMKIDWTFEQSKWAAVRKRFLDLTRETLKAQQLADARKEQAAKEAQRMEARRGARKALWTRKEKEIEGFYGVDDGAHELEAVFDDKSPLKSRFPRTWEHGYEPRVLQAADSFDARVIQRAGDAQRHMASVGGRADARENLREHARLDETLLGLRGIRYTVQPLRLKPIGSNPIHGTLREAAHEHTATYRLAGETLGAPWEQDDEVGFDDPAAAEEVEVPKAVEAVVPETKVWSLGTSIWAPRRKWSDGKDFYHHDDILFKRFSNDWAVALRLGIVKLVMRFDDDADEDADGDGVSDEVEEVGAVLFTYCQMYTLVFQTYSEASISGGDDLQFVTLNGWSEFCSDCGLVNKKSKFCKRSDLDAVFLEADAMAARDQAAQAKLIKKPGAPTGSGTSKLKALGRVEFMAALVRVAINKYVASGKDDAVSDVSEALNRLFADDIIPTIGNTTPMPDSFRCNVAYTEAVSLKLESSKKSLTVLFTILAESTPPQGLVSLTAWRALLGALRFFEDGVLSDREATLCFVWSVMAVENGQERRGYHKENNLPFEGFLEAICRLSMFVPLPTDADIEKSFACGATDAGTAMYQLTSTAASNPSMAAHLKKVHQQRADSWESAMHHVFEQPFDSRVKHFLNIIMRRVEQSEEKCNDAVVPVVSLQEARQWLKARGLEHKV